MGTFHRKATLATLGAALASLSACNDTAFVAGTGLAQKFNPEDCKIGTTTEKVRIMFMIDNSGSTDTTDPAKNYRVATLRKFIADYGSNAYLSYNFGYFSGTTANQYNMVANTFHVNTAPNPVGNSTQLTAALNVYEPMANGGNTPYNAAFNSLKATIAADQSAGNKQNYAVVFMSDGQPTDVSGSGQTLLNNLKALVTGLQGQASANGSLLTLSTVYFGSATDTTSINNLKAMASSGGGQFVDTNANGNVVINDLVVVPGACTL